MTPPPQPLSAATLAHVAAARRTALVGLLRPEDEAAVGMARPAVVLAKGPDAARFLHSQLTNEVEKLEPGEGNQQARVARTGHVQQLFSLHRLPAELPTFLLLVDAAQAQALHDDLDGFLFADDLTLTVDRTWWWIAVQGPKAAEILDAAIGPIGFEPWSTLPEGSVRPLTRARGGLALPPGTLAIRRSLGGDVGFLIGLRDEALADTLARRFAQVEPTPAVVDGDAFSAALEVLRVEAGIVRLSADLSGRRRILPETGLEQTTVSYTKGCYLGQEIIARVRTYGAVPWLLRALLVDGATDPLHPPPLPAPGSELLLTDGTSVGHIATATWSPTRGHHTALAWLGRAWRTPGQVLTFQAGFTATVALLPLYSAPDTAARVRQLYDLAIRTFADGHTDRALDLLEEALRLDPSFGDACEAIGVILGKAGRLHEAIDFFRRLEEVAPDEPMVNTNLSLYYMKLGDKTTAEDEAGKATLKSMARARGGRSATVDADLEQSRVKDAQRKSQMFRKVLAFDEADAIALFGLGNALLTLGQPEEAAESLARAVAVDKNNSAIYLAYGKALEKLDRYEQAIETYRAGLGVASRKGDLMPLKEMEHRLLLLGASRG